MPNIHVAAVVPLQNIFISELLIKWQKSSTKSSKKNPKQCLSRFVEFCPMILEKTFRSFQCNLLFSNYPPFEQGSKHSADNDDL